MAVEWEPISTMPEGVMCMTKIDDENGVRNEQSLMKKSRILGVTRPMFWVDTEQSMYVYYTPTHWKDL
jgi:hypothetical protein